VDLADRRPPVIYTVVIAHHWDGSLGVQVNDVQDDPRSRASVRDTLLRLAEAIKAGEMFADEDT
jgi:hypothetical protein